MKSRNTKRKHKLKHISQYFLIMAIVFFLVFVGILVYEYVNFNSIEKRFAEPHVVELEDECSLIMGNLVHQIRDETDCNLRCKNACNVEGSKFVESEFVFSNNSCHNCSCYCK